MATFKNLTLRQIVTAARRYDLDPHDKLVIESARQADDLHGTFNSAFNRTGQTWATDYRGYFQADQLLDGYLLTETACIRAEANAYRLFERDAYGAEAA